MDTPQHDLPLNELKAIFGMSVRAYNVCRNEGLVTLAAISSHRTTDPDFKKLRNIGVKSAAELKELVDRALEAGYGLSVERTARPMEAPGVLDAWFDEHYFALSRLAQSALLGLIGELSATQALQFYAQDDVVAKLTGPPTRIKELMVFGERLLERAGRSKLQGQLPTPPGPTEVSEAHHWLRRHGFPTGSSAHLVDGSGRLTLFRFLHHIQVNKRNSLAQQAVFEAHAMGPDKEVELRALTDALLISRARISQLAKSVGDQIAQLTACAIDAPGLMERYPQLNLKEPVVIVSPEVVHALNAEEGTDWSALFYLHVLLNLYHDRYTVLHWSDLGVAERAGARKDGMLPVLIHRGVQVEALKVFSTLQAFMEEPRTEPVHFDPELLLKEIPTAKRQLVRRAVDLLLPHLYGELLTAEGTLVLAASASQRKDSLLEAVLTFLDRTATVEELVVAWNTMYPDRPTHASALRGIVSRHPETFFSIGRTSTYGLTRWEQEKPGMKGGTIRNIVREELERAGGPLPVSAIMEVVLRYRQTNRRNVVTNLSMCEPPEFVFLSGDRIALVGNAAGPALDLDFPA